MRKKCCSFFIIFIASSLLVSCEKNVVTSNETVIRSDKEIVAAEVNDELSAAPEPEEQIIQEDTVSENVSIQEEKNDEAVPEILHFVDVFQEEYEVEINPNIAPKEFNDEFFIRDGEMLRYEDEHYYSRLGIDISKHQGSIDWHKVKESGVEFVFIRIGFRGYGKEGSLNPDERFKENISGAQKEGLDVGVYFFAQAINDDEAREEADFVIDLLDGYELQLPVVYDPESILDVAARTDDVTPEQFTRNSEIFCRTISHAGYSPMIYSNMLWEAYELDLEKLSEYPIWYADYEPYPQTPYAFEFWQYTNEGRVPGISGAVDLNIQIMKK